MIWSDHGNSQRSHWTGCRARGGELCLSKPRHGPEAGNRQDIRFSFLNVLYFNRRFGSKHRDFATSFPTLYAWQRAHVLAIHFRLLSEEGSKTIRLAITRGPAPPATPELLLPICPPETPLRPNLNTYWVVPHKFLAGEYPGNKDPVKARRKINRFLEVGVRHFIDLTESGELVPYGSILSEEALRANITVTHERFPIPDLSVPRAAADLDEILLTIDRRIREGGTVFLHCSGGVGRTGLVVGCWLHEHCRTPDDALAELRRKWSTVEKTFRKPESPETTEQVNWVKTWPQRRRDVQQLLLRDRYRGALLGLAVADAPRNGLRVQGAGHFQTNYGHDRRWTVRSPTRPVDGRCFDGIMSRRKLNREALLRPEGSDGSLLPVVEGGIPR